MKTNRWQKVTTIWQSLSTGSTNRKIFGAAMIVAGGTAFVKVIAVVKELVVAWKFGTAGELDAFIIALIIPTVIINIIADSFNSALIPTYIQVRDKEGKAAAQRFFSSATIWSIGLLMITTFVIIVGSPLYLPYLTGKFSPEKLELTYQLLWTISPMIVITGIHSVWGAVLNAGERFALVALVAIVTPAVTIILLLTMQAWGAFDLALGMVLGQLIETIIVGIALHRQGMSLWPKWYGLDDNLKQLAGQYMPMVAASLLMCSSELIDRSMAALLPSGSIAALAYGEKIISLPLVIGTTALSTAVIPYFSQMVAQNDWRGLQRALKSYLGLIFAITIPLTGLIILFSEQIVGLLLQRGSFTATNTQLVAQIQACFALQLPVYAGCILVVRLHSAIRNNKMMMWGALGNLVVNISLNYLFVQWFGVAGIALSTSCVYLFSFVFLLFFLIRYLKTAEHRDRISKHNESVHDSY